MSGLTVKRCFEMFPEMKFKDMTKIMGSENFTEDDLISPECVAKYNGQFSQPLSIFYAKNDTNAFIPLLDKDRQTSIMQQAGIRAEDVSGLQHDTENNDNKTVQSGQIPMETSIFDIAYYQDKNRSHKV